MSDLICRICGNPISLSKDDFEISSLEGSAHIDCIKRKEHEDWCNSMKTFFKVDKLEQENQELRDRWERLKEFLIEEKEEVKVLIDPCAEEYFELCNILGTLERVLDKINEMEEQNNA